MCECCCDPCCCPESVFIQPVLQPTFSLATVVATPSSGTVILSSGETVNLPPHFHPRPSSQIIVEREARNPATPNLPGPIAGALGVTPQARPTFRVQSSEVFPVPLEGVGSPERPLNYKDTSYYGSDDIRVQAQPRLGAIKRFSSVGQLAFDSNYSVAAVLSADGVAHDDFNFGTNQKLRLTYRLIESSIGASSTPGASIPVDYLPFEALGWWENFNPAPASSGPNGPYPQWGAPSGAGVLLGRDDYTAFDSRLDTLELDTGVIALGPQSSLPAGYTESYAQPVSAYHYATNDNGSGDPFVYEQTDRVYTRVSSYMRQVSLGVFQEQPLIDFGGPPRGFFQAIPFWSTSFNSINRVGIDFSVPDYPADFAALQAEYHDKSWQIWARSSTGPGEQSVTFPAKALPDKFRSAEQAGTEFRLGDEGSSATVAGVSVPGVSRWAVLGLRKGDITVVLEHSGGVSVFRGRTARLDYSSWDALLEALGVPPEVIFSQVNGIHNSWRYPYDRIYLYGAGIQLELGEFDAYRDLDKAQWKAAGFPRPRTRAKYRTMITQGLANGLPLSQLEPPGHPSGLAWTGRRESLPIQPLESVVPRARRRVFYPLSVQGAPLSILQKPFGFWDWDAANDYRLLEDAQDDSDSVSGLFTAQFDLGTVKGGVLFIRYNGVITVQVGANSLLLEDLGRRERDTLGVAVGLKKRTFRAASAYLPLTGAFALAVDARAGRVSQMGIWTEG